MKTFNFQSHQVRIALKGDWVWFNASDVAKAIGYKNPAQALRDNVEPKYICQIDLGTRGKQPLFLAEPGLYQLILKSTLPAAKTFQCWVYEQVLPSIRKTGQFQGEMPLAELGKLMDALPQLIQQEEKRQSPSHIKAGDLAVAHYSDKTESCRVLAILGSHANIRLLNDKSTDIVLLNQLTQPEVKAA